MAHNDFVNDLTHSDDVTRSCIGFTLGNQELVITKLVFAAFWFLFSICIIILKTSDNAGVSRLKALLHLPYDEFRSWLWMVGKQVYLGY